jgi:mono/diheme cytochrome c family protein/thiol-disulfide isomerase/thioredoxin
MSQMPAKGNSVLIATMVGLFAIAVVGGLLIGKKRSILKTPAPEQSASRGLFLYQGMCASCHGSEGRGDGVSAQNLKSAPRDFSLRPWKTLVNLLSIKKVIVEGIPGTVMPGIKNALAEPDLDALAKHVLKLSDQNPSLSMKVVSATDQIAIDAGFVLVANNPAPLLQLEDEQGNKSKLSDYKDKTVMLHFWGVQCPHCLKEMQSLLELEKSFHGKSFVVMHVCTDEDDAKVAQQIASKYAPGIKIVVETSGIGLARYEVQTLPAFWLIGSGGLTLARSTGAKDWASSSCKSFIANQILK